MRNLLREMFGEEGEQQVGLDEEAPEVDAGALRQRVQVLAQILGVTVRRPHWRTRDGMRRDKCFR